MVVHLRFENRSCVGSSGGAARMQSEAGIRRIAYEAEREGPQYTVQDINKH